MKIFKLSAFALICNLFLVSAASAATCTLNGELIPCDEMPFWFWGIMAGMFVLGILGFVFWLWMLIDAIKHQVEHKIMWVLLIVMLNILGALLYYFLAKRGRQMNTLKHTSPQSSL